MEAPRFAPAERASDPPTIEELLEHAGFLRRLALALVKDETLAEDLVQDTWVEALRRPPPERGNLRRWLAVVARRLSSRRVRAWPSRPELEWARERTTLERAPDEHLEQSAVAQVLADQVRSLAEPYREALFLRFYADLPPRAIALRSGCSIHTVNSRLQRGLALLRVKLERARGGREAWRWGLLVFLRDPPAPTAGRVPARVPGWLARPAARLAGLFGVSLLGLALAWRSTAGTSMDERLVAAPSAEPSPSARAATGVVAHVLADPPPSADALGSPDARTPVGAPQALLVSVLDADETPLADALVYMVGLGLAEPDVRAIHKVRLAGATGPLGTLEVPLVRGDVGWSYGRLSVAAWAEAEGHVKAPLHFVALGEARPGGVRAVRLHVGGPDQVLRGRVLTGLQPVVGAQVTVGLGGAVEHDQDLVRWSQPSLARTGPDGGFVVRGLPPGPQRVVARAEGLATCESWSDALGEDGQLVLQLEAGCTLSGLVRDPRGRPAPGVLVLAHGDPGRPDWTTRTDEAGRFRLQGLPPGPRHLGAYTEDLSAVAWQLSELDAAQEQVWEPSLTPEPLLEFQLVDERGERLRDHAVLVTVDSPATWSRPARATGAGSFRVLAPPEGPLQLLVYRSWEALDEEPSRPHFVLELERRPREPLRVRVPGTPAGRLALQARVSDPAGRAPRGARLRLIDSSPLTSREAPVDEESGMVRLHGVLPGRYLLGVEDGRRGTLVLRECELPGDGAQDLGTLRLPETARLSVSWPAPPGSLLRLSQELAGRRTVVDRTPLPRTYELFPGRYVLTIRSPDGSEHEEVLTLSAGEERAWSPPPLSAQERRGSRP